MDAFVVRKRRAPHALLFERDAFLLVPRTSGAATSESELHALAAANGARILASEDDATAAVADGRVVVALLLAPQLQELSPTDAEMLARLVRGGATVVRVQWARDCVAQQARLATHAYEQTRAVRALAKTVSDEGGVRQTVVVTMEVEDIKRRRMDAVVAAAPTETLADSDADAPLPTPHLTPWKDVSQGSLLILNARSKQQQELTAAASPADTSAKIKIAGFDMDGTWIETKSGKRFATDAHDWKWLHPTRVRAKLQELVRAGFELVLFSNQNGVAKGNVTAKEIQDKVEAIVKSLDLPVLAILATKSDMMRKPRLGGWCEMLKVLGVDAKHVDMDASFYCGDAAGRPKIAGRAKDFAATDYKFALNLGIQFHTPEALFLGSTQRVHTHPDMWEIGFDPRPLFSATTATAAWLAPPSVELAKSTQEIVVLTGPPASGKSFFSKTHFPSYTIVNQDELKTLANCKKHCLNALAQKKSVVIDSTNRDARTRKIHNVVQNVPIRCFEMDVEKPLSMHLNTFRSLTEEKKIPDIAIHAFYKNFVPPQAREGFAEIVKVRFKVERAQLPEDKYALLASFL